MIGRHLSVVAALTFLTGCRDSDISTPNDRRPHGDDATIRHDTAGSTHQGTSILTAFVKRTPDTLISTGSGECEATELWVENGKTRELLVRGRADDDITKTIAEISDPKFDPEMRTLYFVSAAWATSGSIQKVDLKSKKISYLIDGNGVEVIFSGPNKGRLIVDRALIKHDENGESTGRNSYLWLVSPEGKPMYEIGTPGSITANLFSEQNPTR